MRGPGRPRTQYEAMGVALAPLGGLQTVVETLAAQGLSVQGIRDRLTALTGVSVHRDTLRRWMRDWEV
jgi:hypothetical protein